MNDSPAGIAVVPGRELLIVFTAAQPGSRARVSLTDGDEVTVRASIGAARYTSEVDRLVIDNRGPAATFDIGVPRGATRVEIRVEGRRLFLKEGSRISTEVSGDPGGPYLLLLSPAGR